MLFLGDRYLFAGAANVNKVSLAKKNKWTLAEMEERSEYLIGRALSIWAAPVTEYKPEEKQLDRSKKAPHHWFNSGDEDLFLFYSGIEPKQIAGI